MEGWNKKRKRKNKGLFLRKPSKPLYITPEDSTDESSDNNKTNNFRNADFQNSKSGENNFKDKSATFAKEGEGHMFNRNRDGRNTTDKAESKEKGKIVLEIHKHLKEIKQTHIGKLIKRQKSVIHTME